MLVEIILLTLAYLLGSIPFGYLLVKYLFTAGEDVRQVGSGGIGATNVTRRAGLKAGLLTYLLDVAKGYAAVALMDAVTDDYRWIGAAAVAAIAGHILPVFLKFRGGKGVATGVGVYLYIAPLAVVTTLALWSLIVYLTRYVSLASIIATAAVPLWTLLYYGWLPREPHPNLTIMLIVAVSGCALIIAKHHENIVRLLEGRENKIGKRVGPSNDQAAMSGGRG
ncbi:MAG TPA: glycerol-3-phosphate 1-O-acyltransferase PlsY [Blastocatellia bacterium]|jgi:glycerol-3-phosphate acyltransferase PlsY